MASHRLSRPPTISRRGVYLDRQSLSLRYGVSPARPLARGSFLVGPGCALVFTEALARRSDGSRSRAGYLDPATVHHRGSPVAMPETTTAEGRFLCVASPCIPHPMRKAGAEWQFVRWL